MAGLGAMRIPPVCASHVVLATGLQGTLACLKVFPAGWPGLQETRQDMQTSSGQVPSSRDQSTVPGEAPKHLSQVLGVKGRSSMERSPLFASGAAGRADCCWWRWPGRRVREAPLAVRIRHRDRRTREQHYHSKDPMGAIQQIPY